MGDFREIEDRLHKETSNIQNYKGLQIGSVQERKNAGLLKYAEFFRGSQKHCLDKPACRWSGVVPKAHNMSQSIHDLLVCHRCRKLKPAQEGRRFRIPGRCHDYRFHCSACDTAPRRHQREDSFLEQEVSKCLHRLGVPFRREVEFDKYRADYALDSLALVIEADGGRWHQGHRRERDAAKTSFIQARRCDLGPDQLGQILYCSWKVVRVTANDTTAQVDAAVTNRQTQLKVARAARAARYEEAERTAQNHHAVALERWQARQAELAAMPAGPIAPPPARLVAPVYRPPNPISADLAEFMPRPAPRFTARIRTID